MNKIMILISALAIMLTIPIFAPTENPVAQLQEKPGAVKNLIILWTSGEKDVFTKMVHIYSLNAKKREWFKEVTLIVWGPSAKLLAEDPELKEMVKELRETGIILEACIWCTDQYGVTEDLKDLQIDVKGMGAPLTEYIKDPGKTVVVF